MMLWRNSLPGFSLRLKSSDLEMELEKQYPCVSCKNWPMLTPIYQCEEGHAICNPCSLTNRCATCNKDLPEKKIRNRAVEVLQPALTKCSQEGCNQVFANEADMKDHVWTKCNYIEVSLCKIMELDHGKCDVKLKPANVREAIEHLCVEHGAIGHSSSSLHSFDYQWSISGEPEVGVSPGLWYIAEDNAAIILQVIEKDWRRWIRIFGFGDRSRLPWLRVTLKPSILKVHLSSGLAIGGEMVTRFGVSMASVTDEDADVYKDVFTFDAGPSLMTLEKLLVVVMSVTELSSLSMGKKEVIEIGDEETFAKLKEKKNLENEEPERYDSFCDEKAEAIQSAIKDRK